jgi:hypothetical protein
MYVYSISRVCKESFQLCGVIDAGYVLEYMVSFLGGYEDLSRLLVTENPEHKPLDQPVVVSSSPPSPPDPVHIGPNAGNSPTSPERSQIHKYLPEYELTPERILEPDFKQVITNKDLSGMDIAEVVMCAQTFASREVQHSKRQGLFVKFYYFLERLCRGTVLYYGVSHMYLLDAYILILWCKRHLHVRG